MNFLLTRHSCGLQTKQTWYSRNNKINVRVCAWSFTQYSFEYVSCFSLTASICWYESWTWSSLLLRSCNLIRLAKKKNSTNSSSLTTASDYAEKCFPPHCPVLLNRLNSHWTPLALWQSFQIKQYFVHLPKIKLFIRQYMPSSLLLPCHCKCLGSN